MTCASISEHEPLYMEEKGCTDKCVSPAPFYQKVEMVCVEACPGEEPYHLASGRCRERCPPQSSTSPGRFACRDAYSWLSASLSVSFAGTTYSYLYRLARSYASLSWGAQGGGSVAAFLETGSVLRCLRLRAAAKEVTYAPVVFFRAERVLGCELQLTGRTPAGSAILGAVLLRDARLSGCFLSASFEERGKYPVALHTLGHVARVSRSIVDLGKGVAASGLVQE